MNLSPSMGLAIPRATSREDRISALLSALHAAAENAEHGEPGRVVLLVQDWQAVSDAVGALAGGGAS